MINAHTKPWDGRNWRGLTYDQEVELACWYWFGLERSYATPTPAVQICCLCGRTGRRMFKRLDGPDGPDFECVGKIACWRRRQAQRGPHVCFHSECCT